MSLRKVAIFVRNLFTSEQRWYTTATKGTIAMPTYVYHCDTCDTNFEKFQKFSEDPLQVCPEGHEGVRRVITPSAIIFKGSGWYITDSKSGSNGGSATSTPPSDKESSKPAESKSEGSTDSKSESKSETKVESKSESKTSSSTEAA
jgi:putative FmdB family regulatory protein